jgi:hypothetical protein
MSTATMWKAPARREYNPKPMDPGQVIVWTVRIDAHWTVPPRYDSETGIFTEGIGWVETLEYERIGTIWSLATSANSWWVVPEDDDPDPLVVRRAGKSLRDGFPEGALYQSGECADWRQGIRRAENVRKRGIYAVVLTEPMRDGSGPYTAYSYRCWHSDPDCPEAAGLKRDERDGSWTPGRIVDVLVGREQHRGPLPFCPRCVMLEDSPEPARELVTA